jgi:hypothetical protein
MLQNKTNPTVNLHEEKINAYQLLPAELKQYLHSDNRIWQLNYPVNSFPEKITSVTFDKDPVIAGVLNGIKGQYLIFTDGRVLNIRKHNGYFLEISTTDKKREILSL